MAEGHTYALIDRSKQTISRANDTVSNDTIYSDDLHDATGGQIMFSTESNKHGEFKSNTGEKDHRNLDSSPEEETVMEENDDLNNQR